MKCTRRIAWLSITSVALGVGAARWPRGRSAEQGLSLAAFKTT